MDENFSFGYWLRRQRLARDMRQAELAAQLGVAPITLRKIEADDRRPSLQLIARVAEVFALDAAEHALLLRVARADLTPAALPLPERAADAAPPPALPRTNLPTPLTPFLGRARELSALEALLAQPGTRLVTIIGHGGMGKTRLAQALGERLVAREAFPDGVFLAALAPISDAAHLEPAVADALGFPLSASGPPQGRQLSDYLRSRRALLVLDNCEHVREGVVALAAALLAAAPDLQILATSRERLDLPGEQRFPLAGLSAESEEDGVALFAAAAARLQPEFVLDARSHAEVLRICREVGGMPLAIELAAGWVDTLSLEAIAAAVAQDLGMLEAGSAALPPRHQSIRAIFEATWRQLDQDDRAVFARLAVFRGGCTARAVEAIAEASVAQLRRFVSRALLQYEIARDRYSIHELLRQYAGEQLAADGATEQALRDRHAAYYLRELAAREADLHGPRQLEALGEIARDGENLRAAWNWAAASEALHLLGPAAGCLLLAYEWLGRSADGLAAMRAAVASADRQACRLPNAGSVVGERAAAPAELYAELLAAQARFTYLSGDVPGAVGLLQQAEAMLDARGSGEASTDAARARVQLQLGRCLAYQDPVAARAALSRSQALCLSLGDQWGAAVALISLSVTAHFLHHDAGYAEAEGYLRQSVALCRALGDRQSLGEALAILSMNERYQSRVPESEALAREAYALAQASGNPRSIAQASSNLGAALFWSGKNEESYDVLRAALETTEDLGNRAELPTIYYRLGNATAYLGRYAEARATYRAGLEAAQAVGDVSDTAFLLFGLSSLALAERADAEARGLAEQVIVLSQRLGDRYLQHVALVFCAFADRRLGDVVRARARVADALRSALPAPSSFHWAMWAAALLLADSGASERAAAALALTERMQVADTVLNHDVALRELRSVVAALPPQSAAAARARWAGRTLREAGSELLAELEAEGWGVGAGARASEG